MGIPLHNLRSGCIPSKAKLGTGFFGNSSDYHAAAVVAARGSHYGPDTKKGK